MTHVLSYLSSHCKWSTTFLFLFNEEIISIKWLFIHRAVSMHGPIWALVSRSHESVRRAVLTAVHTEMQTKQARERTL